MPDEKKSSDNDIGTYTEPRRISVGGINTDIVDPHHESFPFIHKLSFDEGVPLIVWFVDSHRDLLGKVDACEIKNGRFHSEFFDEVITDPMEYARKYLKEDNFNCPLFHLGNIAALYYFDPYFKRITAYGRVGKKGEIKNPLRTYSNDFYIRWTNSPKRCDGEVIPDEAGERISPQKFIKDMAYLKYLDFIPFLNIDLDAFLNGSHSYGSENSQYHAAMRLDWTANILSHVPKPKGIVIARSQTPHAYVPPNRVDEVQEATLKGLRKIY